MGREYQQRAEYFQETLLYFKVKQQQTQMKSRQRKTYRSKKGEHTSPCSPRGYHPEEAEAKRGSPMPSSPVPNCPTNLNQVLKENSQLRKEIVELKFNQFYQFDNQKLKELIQELEQLRKEIKILKGQVTELQTENNFLKVNNFHLKNQLEKQIQSKSKELILKTKGSVQKGKPSQTTVLTHITDSSRNTEDSISQLGNYSPNIHFLQNTTLEEVLRESKPPNDYEMTVEPKGENRTEVRDDTLKEDNRNERKELRKSRRQFFQKMISPKNRKETSKDSPSNEYLLYKKREKGRAPE